MATLRRRLELAPNANPFTLATYMRKWNAVKLAALPPWLLGDLPPTFSIEELMNSV
jgi:hypothetical protein